MSQLLGQLLVKSGVISPHQLEEAIQAQVIFGGRLGTSLVELGYVDIATLSRFLAKKFSVPTIDHSRLAPCPRELLKLFGKKLALKYEAVPLTLEGNRLDVLMSNPNDVAALDEIGFATGKKVKPYVAPELIVMALMEKYFGIQRDMRYIKLSISDTRSMRREHAAPSKSMMDDANLVRAAKKADERPDISKLELKKGEELTSETEFREMMDQFQAASDQAANQAESLPKPPPPQPRPPVAQPQPPSEQVMDLEEMVKEPVGWEVKEPARGVIEEEEEIEEDLDIIEELPEALSLAEAAQRLKEIGDRDELSQVVLAFALSYFKRAALFITRNEMALGWDGMGGAIHKKIVQGIMLPLNAPSIFKTVHDSMAFFLGAVPKTPINERFLKAMGDEKPLSVFLIPILFNGQVVNILYGDNGDGQNAPFDISDLLILAPKIPQAFEELIHRKKKQLAS
jgi:MshEN domain